MSGSHRSSKQRSLGGRVYRNIVETLAEIDVNLGATCPLVHLPPAPFFSQTENQN
jgi:hypothetical protein